MITFLIKCNWSNYSRIANYMSIIFVRYIMVIFNNWNEDWHNDNGNQGPEVIKHKIFHKQG